MYVCMYVPEKMDSFQMSVKLVFKGPSYTRPGRVSSMPQINDSWEFSVLFFSRMEFVCVFTLSFLAGYMVRGEEITQLSAHVL